MNAVSPRGAGGGGPKPPSPPTEAPNTLRARQILRAVYLVSEGPVLGLIDGGKSIYFDDTPLVAADGKSNFLGAKWEIREGNAGQQPFSGIPIQDSSTTALNIQVTKSGGPITRVVDCTGYDRIRITMGVAALVKTDTSGNQTGTAVAYEVWWRQTGSAGGFQLLFTDTIDGKTMAPYARAKTVAVPFNGQIDVRVYRTTDDSSSSSVIDGLYWTSHSLILDQKLSYPGSCVIAVELDQEQYKAGVPVITFGMRGLLCSVPDIYDPATATYTGGAGAWSGTLAKKYTNNPAWILYTLLTDPDWGCGRLLTGTTVSQSKWWFHQIAQYCDELVPDGFGGQERRYTFNAWINTRDEAMRVAHTIAAAFRGMLYFGAGAVVPVADMPGPVVKDVNPTNVVNGKIEFEGSSFRARHSVVKVRWRDPNLGYRESIEVVEDPELIQLIGVKEAPDYEATGCTSRGLARRLGRWILFSEKYETKVARYVAGLDHANVRPGEIIAVQHPKLAGAAFSGRLIQLVSGTALKLDRDVALQSGQSYSIRLALPDGTMSSLIAITNALPTSTRDITLAASLPAANLPEQGCIWTIVASNVAPMTARVLQSEEDSHHTYAITALQHHPGKYASIESGMALIDDPYTLFRDYPSGLMPPTNPTAVEFLQGIGITSLLRVDFSWTLPAADARAVAFEAQALSNGSVIRSEVTQNATVTFADLQPGIYSFQVRTLGSGGLVSPFVATGNITVDGMADPPGGPVALAAIGGIRSIAIRWNASTNRLFRDAEIHASSNSVFSAGGVVGRVNSREFVHTGLSPSATWWYWVRFYNTLGQESPWVGPVSATTAQLSANDIADAILNTAKFAASIAPVGLVTTVPAALITDGGRPIEVIYDRTTEKIFRWNGTAYTASVPTADLDGTITTTQISDDAISTPKIAANAIVAAKIAADAITADKLAANSVVAGKIAAGAVSATEIAAGAIVSDKLAANSVTAAKLATADLITITAQIGDGVITNAKIADAAITSAKIGTAAITAAKIGDLEVNTLKLAYGAISDHAAAAWSGSHAGGETTLCSASLSTPYGGRLIVLCVANGEGMIYPDSANYFWIKVYINSVLVYTSQEAAFGSLVYATSYNIPPGGVTVTINGGSTQWGTDSYTPYLKNALVSLQLIMR
jgi:predicted phage tail protein